MNLFNLLQLKHAIKLEELGMKTRGGSANAHAARLLGLPGRPNRKTVLAAIEEKIEQIKSGEVKDTGPKIISAR